MIAVTNLDQVKTLHLAKGEVVGFARSESPDVAYIATTNGLNIEETPDTIPRNWIPQQKLNMKSQALRQPQDTLSKYSDSSRKLQAMQETIKVQMCEAARKHMAPTFQQSRCESSEPLWESLPEGAATGPNTLQHNRDCSAEKRKSREHLWESLDQQWCDISN